MPATNGASELKLVTLVLALSPAKFATWPCSTRALPHSYAGSVEVANFDELSVSFFVPGRVGGNVTDFRNGRCTQGTFPRYQAGRGQPFYSPPNGDGRMWWSVTPSSSLLAEFRH